MEKFNICLTAHFMGSSYCIIGISTVKRVSTKFKPFYSELGIINIVLINLKFIIKGLKMPFVCYFEFHM